MHAKPRFIEIDLLRTIAIVFMVVYHAAYDLFVFYSVELDVFSGTWWLIGRTAANLFLLLVGVSFVVSSLEKTKQNVWANTFKRAIKIGSCAMIITAGTYIFDAETYVRFGILHCIAISLLLLPLFQKLREWNALLGLLIIALSTQTDLLMSSTPYLLPFGIRYQGFSTIDYFPLIPWFGVVLVGMAFGYFVYGRGTRKPTHYGPLEYKLTWPGRYSLILYMIHQPLLMLLFKIIL